MDTRRTAIVRQKNVDIGGGKATVTMKPDKLKTAGKKRKALKDLRSTYLPDVGASKDDNLKLKSTRKGNKVKKNQMTQGKQSKSVLQGFGKGNKPFDPISIDEIKQCSVWAPIRRIFTDEEIKEYYDEWAKDGIEEIEKIIKSPGFGRSAEYIKKPKISKMVIPGSMFGEAFTSEEKGYKKKTDESDFKISDPGRLSSVYTPEELEPEELELGDLAELLLRYENPLPELKLNDDY